MQGVPPGQAPGAPSVPCEGAPSVTLLQFTVPQEPANVNGRQIGTEPPGQTRAVTFGVVSVQMLTVTVPVEVQPATPGAVSV